MMLRMLYQQLKSAKKWVWNNLNCYEHEVDFVRRCLKDDSR
jgi:hypothetical protein